MKVKSTTAKEDNSFILGWRNEQNTSQCENNLCKTVECIPFTIHCKNKRLSSNQNMDVEYGLINGLKIYIERSKNLFKLRGLEILSCFASPKTEVLTLLV